MAVGDRLSEAISDAVVHKVVGESLNALDEQLATHYYLEDVYVDSHKVTCITLEAIHFNVSGTLDVTLQWGSNSDLRNRDEAEMDELFDFTCELTCGTPNPDSNGLELVNNFLARL